MSGITLCHRSNLAGLVVLFSATGLAGGSGPDETDFRRSVVKIFSTQHYPDLVRPWSRQSPEEITGSGVVIEGNRILTNAHVVAYARQIFVQPFRSADKYRATAAAAAHGIDLAILTLEDPSFFEDHPAAPIADELPLIGDTVKAYGYPMGGEALATTEGIVSRIEFSDYYYDTAGLRIQVDAALNPGNSGGPAVSGKNVIGLVFSGIDEAENIGYVIPAEEIRAFLADVADGSYGGRLQLFDETQTLENPALREKLGADRQTTGMMVLRPHSVREDYPLRPWDVLTAIGDYDIDNAGMVEIDDNLRLLYRYLVPRLASDDRVRLTVFRDRASLVMDVPVARSAGRLKQYLAGRAPSYQIYGPLVFTPAYEEFLGRLSAEYLIGMSSPLATRGGAEAAFEGEELVIVPAPMFPHPLTQGYEITYPPVLARVNGTAIRNLRHLVETLRDLTDEYVVFEWAGSGTETMVYRRKEMVEATADILELNGIRAPCSSDLSDLWPREGN